MLARLAALDARQRALVARALGWVLVARAVLAAGGGRALPAQERRLARLAARLPAAPPCTAAEAAWAITAAGRRVPGTRCLAWSLALCGLLAQAGVAAELRIGVAASGPGRIEAHAWVSSGGRDLSWGGGVGRYNPLRPRAAAR
jgi:hypothetical protein